MIRSWGKVQLSGFAQPWFGDTLTAAVALPRGDGTIVVTVGSTTRYKIGDRIYLDPGKSNQDLLLIQTIQSSTVLICISEGGATTNTHANGALVQLHLSVIDVQIQALDGNAGAVWLGSDSTVTATGGGSAFRQLQKVTAGQTPNEWRSGYGADHDIAMTSDGWFCGTSTDYALFMAEVL
jgi:hypothetical protein